MKRSEINKAISTSKAFFEQNGWVLPPNPKWDITDFGLGDFDQIGLVLINLAEEVEYCEKLMYAAKGQTTPAHYHEKKKEDIICRTGEMEIQFWAADPNSLDSREAITLKKNGKFITIQSGDKITLKSGERVTIVQGLWHEFYPTSDQCIIGEVSTANDDVNDNFFFNKKVGRFSDVVEDEEKMYL
ncbi:D-lyxose/D-mannose family sugar isomerase [Mucilaginibacter hurinus]|uniref:D-lyxose ketol-isomerase n=1 Tax=Mucilaginibacter hurinus TaxID=2201324 RepID=A0A367GM03_9SPHI|nr:D-lyxose/D-mannose family sugar isomerase [Mucilaginibacter hurinus]RCH54360.1 D-lyxose/D-mannose family sugar isomerase [Mucilaginibacter hurinus]